MPDPTDATCERCGHRYHFLRGEPRRLSPKRARIVARGLKDFVLTDWQSLDGAISLAHDDEARRNFARAAAAFQATFNFCFTCRRSVCPNCWNDAEGSCLSCVPFPIPAEASVPGQGPMPVPVWAEALEPPAAPAPAAPVAPAPAEAAPHETAAPLPVRWPRPTPWMERPVGSHGQAAAAEATTIPRDPIPVMAETDQPEPVWPNPAPWIQRTLLAEPVPVLRPIPPAPPPLISERDDEPVNADLRCHNCGVPNPPRTRFCQRCRLQITRWSDSTFEDLAVGQD